MYAGCESVGGPCKRSMCPSLKMEWKVNCEAGGYCEIDSCNCGDTRTELDGDVPSLEQFTAQHRRADADSAVWAFMRAALQQSMSPMASPIGHICSPESIGTPAKALPPSTSKSTRDVILILMAKSLYGKQLIRVKIRRTKLDQSYTGDKDLMFKVRVTHTI
jgi:hypothetical protein